MEFPLTPPALRLESSVSLEEVAERERALSHGGQDYPGVTLPRTRVLQDGTWAFAGQRGQFTRHALNQLCARLALPQGSPVPAGYLARCPPALVAQNLNYWLTDPHRAEQRVLVRTRAAAGGGFRTVRAILSERYVPVDHGRLLATLQAIMPQHPLTVQAWSLDEARLTLRLWVQADHPASPTDPLRIGVHLTNSEVGLGAVAFTALITRLVCSNGLIVKVADLGGLHQRHIGRVGENLPVLVHVALARVLAEADRAAQRFVQLREAPAPAPVEAFVRRTAGEVELPEALLPSLIASLEGETLYDVINAFTRAAQPLPVAERVRIETAMSQFLHNGRNGP